ncbi:cell division protein ZapE [Dokdonella sp.]|uniref:cell division protein ZapE n=1 Tax=Dokdonella sp. TaxID=2291710 RepID=UPI00378513C9
MNREVDTATRGVTPGGRYDTGIAAGEWQADPAQRAVLPAFDRLYGELLLPHAPSLWQRLRGERPPAPRGIYLWGRVGRGKTFLTELFYAALPTTRKRRVHFHRFMQDVHAELRTLEGHSDPLVDIAMRLAAELRVLVLDEFFVGDIGDAMILANLLRALFERGVVLVTTSNTPPHALYKDGLQRERFLPAIALLEQHCEVVELVSATDWRLRALKQAPVYYTPPGAAAERAMQAAFQRVAHGELRRDFGLVLNDREVPVHAEADGAIWFEFEALCEGPRGVADYIELVRAYHTLLVSNVPQFTPQTDDAARRFVELVDEVYDHGVNLVLSAAAPIVELYDGERLRAEFARTESRLIEMQSEDYLAREHRP